MAGRRPGHPRRRAAAPQNETPHISRRLPEEPRQLRRVDGRTTPGHDGGELFGRARPQFAVDLLIAKIPIEMGCQGRAKRAACGGRDP